MLSASSQLTPLHRDPPSNGVINVQIMCKVQDSTAQEGAGAMAAPLPIHDIRSAVVATAAAGGRAPPPATSTAHLNARHSKPSGDPLQVPASSNGHLPPCFDAAAGAGCGGRRVGRNKPVFANDEEHSASFDDPLYATDSFRLNCFK